MRLVIIVLRVILVAAVLQAAVTRASAVSAAENRAFKEAKSAFDDTVWDRAQNQFGQFIEKYPRSALAAEAVLYQAQALFRLGRHTNAIQVLRTQQSHAGDKADQYYYWIGESQFRLGDHGAAAESFAALVREFPDSSRCLEATEREAEARARLGQWQQVSAVLADPNGVFQRAALHSPGNEWVIRGWFLLAEAALSSGDPAAAQAALRPLDAGILKSDQHWQRTQLQTRISLAAGRIEEADVQSTNLVLIAGLTARPELTAESWALRGAICERLGRPDKAIEAYGHNLGPGVGVEHQREALGRIAGLLADQGETGQAVERLNLFLEKSTNSIATDVALLTVAELHLKQHVAPAATNLTATTVTSTNHLRLALAALDRLIAQSPGSPYLGKAQLDRGWCFWLSNQPALSLTAFQAAVEKLPVSEELAVAHFKVGDAAFAMKDYATAREAYRSALSTAKLFPRAQASLGDLALYQLGRACLALKDPVGAEEALRQILHAGTNRPLAEPGLLLSAQGYAEAGQAEQARAIFQEFARTFPDSTLGPEAELAAARACEQGSDWPGAIARYEDWVARFTNHVLLPDVEFYRARAYFHHGNETNALYLFNNFLQRFTNHAMVPAAEYWLGDHFFRQGDFPEAEKHFKLLYQYWPGSELAPEACMMAGRAAVGWLNYKNAINHFTNLTANPNCPPDLKSPARFAYASALRLKDEPDPTNRIANLKLAVGVFSVIQEENPGTAQAALARGEIGNTYYQLGALDSQFYPLAVEAFRQAAAMTNANAATLGQAKVGLGMVLEKTASSASPAESREGMLAAFNQYLDVLYDEEGDLFWRKKAGLEALRMGQALGEWSQVEKLCIRLQRLFPPLMSSLEKKRTEAQEKAKNGKRP